MSDTVRATGSCLCGATAIEAEAVSHKVGACHCSICRKWGGGPLLAVDCGTEVKLTGEDKITVYDSSEWAERGFCSSCGTHLFYRLKDSGQYIVPTGLMDLEDGELLFDHQIFIDEKPDYYHFGNETEVMTGEEVFAMYAPPEEK